MKSASKSRPTPFHKYSKYFTTFEHLTSNSWKEKHHKKRKYQRSQCKNSQLTTNPSNKMSLKLLQQQQQQQQQQHVEKF